jgi:hypothetical protein
MMKNKKWYCPHCSQTSSRHWNLKKHIERKHQGRGQPIREDGWHSTPSTATHFIPDMMSLQNENNYHPNQRYQQTLSSASPYSKIEDTSKKRDIVEEFLEFWRPKIQQMKEILEIKNFFNEFSSFSSSLQQRSNIVTSPVQAPIIRPIIPPVTTTPLQQTQPAQSPQEQEQKKENINPLITYAANSSITSTFMEKDLQRRARGVEEGEDSVIIPQEPSLPPYMMTTTSDDNNNNSKKREGEANSTIENTKEKELEEDRHDIEEHPSSKPNFLIDTDNEGNGRDNVFYFNEGKLIRMPDIGGYWEIKRNRHGDIIDASKVITDPLLEAQGC